MRVKNFFHFLKKHHLFFLASRDSLVNRVPHSPIHDFKQCACMSMCYCCSCMQTKVFRIKIFCLYCCTKYMVPPNVSCFTTDWLWTYSAFLLWKLPRLLSLFCLQLHFTSWFTDCCFLLRSLFKSQTLTKSRNNYMHICISYRDIQLDCVISNVYYVWWPWSLPHQHHHQIFRSFIHA